MVSAKLRMPTTLVVIFGSFTLGFYVAIQGPTLMDLIDLLHVNNDTMSFSLAFASLAYAFGGLFSGFLFNYVNRQILIATYFIIFGVANIITPYITSFLIFTCITVFKMMCAGGTDCGANVWILEMWPGGDQWLQALHFTFALGCALGPLVVEPFLSVESKDELDKITGKTSGSTTITNNDNESRIHIPYAVSGLTSITAALLILFLYYLEERDSVNVVAVEMPNLNQASTQAVVATAASANNQQQLATPENTSLIQQPQPQPQLQLQPPPQPQQELKEEQQLEPEPQPPLQPQPKPEEQEPEPKPESQPQPQQEPRQEPEQEPQPLLQPLLQQPQPQLQQQPQPLLQPQTQLQLQPQPQKITSKCREQLVGRPPYYVMLAIALAAMCLSFYCGIEITSMNYLATFAVNIDLQLPKSTAALMSSALTISFAVGRAGGIYVAAKLPPHKLFYGCSGVMAFGNVLMLIFANTAERLLWFSICLFGIGCGPLFPAIVSFYDDKISKVTNTVSGIFILGSMFNVALNSLIIGHHIIDNALILIVCNLIGSVVLFFLFGTLHMLTKVKKQQRVKKYKLQQQKLKLLELGGKEEATTA